MPRLRTADNTVCIDFSLPERGHWLIGRDPSCDLCIVDDAVSRFHTTFFRWHEAIYLLDHSLNGTYLCRNADSLSPVDCLPEAKKPAPGDSLNDTRVVLRTSSPAEEKEASQEEFEEELNKSRLAFRLEQQDARLPRVAGFSAHTLRMRNDLQPQLRAIYGADTVANMASLGRRMSNGHQVVIMGDKPYRLFYDA